MPITAPGFADRRLIAEMTARMLLEVEAVRLRPEEPFRLTSGWVSPVYTDCRKLISYPRLRTTLMDFATSTILRDIGHERLDAIAGGETAGIPFAAWIADRLALPMQYVRKKPKGFGRGARIEGDFEEGGRVLLVEDLATDGNSKIQFCEALREAGLECGHAFVIFNYAIFPGTDEALERAGLRMHALATWRDVLQVAREQGYFPSETLSEVEAFLDDPVGWSAAHGGSDGRTEGGAGEGGRAAG